MPDSSTQSKRMTREEYREVYLRSEHWREIRQAALERAERRCQVCNAAQQLDVHHRTYERLGEERLADLTVLCRRCHDLFHSQRAKPSQAKRKPKRKKTKVAAPPTSMQLVAKEARAQAKQRARDAHRLKPELRERYVTDRERAEAAMERRNAEERRRRKAEREAQAKAEFEAGRDQDARPWDKFDRRAQQARREKDAA